MELGNWSWLEVSKLIVGAATPFTIAIGGIFIHRITKKFEHLQWRSQKLIEKRLVIFDEMVPIFNRLLCYYTYVGAWRDCDPLQIVELKRTLDSKIYIYSPLFSDEFFRACISFQDLCFETYQGWGVDAKLKTQFGRRQQSRSGDWKVEWSEHFSNEVTDPTKIKTAYERVMKAFAEDIGIYSPFTVPQSGRLPSSIH
ncbi:hypothetical protein [Roseiarcus fermentans]|uniref:hypothetical protein n=1 Tax=Roseiarcus fermentans TaxID=1473586 RepID=UPI0011BDA855|nr:hypothetical protein [Roseiarcus fermentans]